VNTSLHALCMHTVPTRQLKMKGRCVDPLNPPGKSGPRLSD
jgi:hypothetical protein